MVNDVDRPTSGGARAVVSFLLLALAGSGLAGCAEGGPFSFLKNTLTASAVAPSPSSNAPANANSDTRLAYNTIEPGGGHAMIGEPYRINGQWYYPEDDPDYSAVGMASWYGDDFHGLETANGETFNMVALTAAHPTLPLPSYARVTNLENGRSLIVRINDRGPFAHGRLIDLSHRAATMLGYENQGVAQVRVDYIGRAPLEGDDEPMLLASYRDSGAPPFPLDSGLPPGVMVASATPPVVPGPPARQAAPVVVAYAPPAPVPAVPSPIVASTSPLGQAASAPATTPVISPAAFSTYFDPIGAAISTSLYTPDNRAFVGAQGAHEAIEAMAAGDALSLGALP